MDFLDVRIAGLNLSQITKAAGTQAVPINVNTDVIHTNGRGADKWSDKLDGTM